MNQEPESIRLLEQELRELSPRRPSELLVQRIEEALASDRAAQPVAGRHLLWTLLGGMAAACLAISALQLGPSNGGLPASRHGVAQQKPRYVAESAVSQLVSEEQGELVLLDDATIRRPVYQEYTDTITWRDPKTQALVRCTVPRQELRLVSVDAY